MYSHAKTASRKKYVTTVADTTTTSRPGIFGQSEPSTAGVVARGKTASTEMWGRYPASPVNGMKVEASRIQRCFCGEGKSYSHDPFLSFLACSGKLRSYFITTDCTADPPPSQTLPNPPGKLLDAQQ